MLKVGAKNPHFTVEKEVRNLILLKEISYAKSSPQICITICKLLAPEYQMTCPSKAITGSPVCFPVLAWPLSYPPPNSHSSDSCSVFPTFQLHCHLTSNNTTLSFRPIQKPTPPESHSCSLSEMKVFRLQILLHRQLLKVLSSYFM